MSEVPESVRRLSEERQRARQARDFATADVLRSRIRDAGFDVVDTPAGPELHTVGPTPTESSSNMTAEPTTSSGKICRRQPGGSIRPRRGNRKTPKSKNSNRTSPARKPKPLIPICQKPLVLFIVMWVTDGFKDIQEFRMTLRQTAVFILDRR